MIERTTTLVPEVVLVRNAQLYLGSGKFPFLYRMVLMSFWDLQSKEVWLRQESVETVPEEINLMEQ